MVLERLALEHDVELIMADENVYVTFEITGDEVGVITTLYGWQHVVLMELALAVKVALASGDMNAFKLKSQLLVLLTAAGGKGEFKKVETPGSPSPT